MKNIIESERSSSLTQKKDKEPLSQERRFPSLVVLILVITWLFYLYVECFLFPFSLFAGMLIGSVIGAVLLVNLSPLVVLIFLTYFSLRKKSVALALLPFSMIVCFVIFVRFT